jgi:hypothetical protein
MWRSRSYTLKFRCEEDYQNWRTLLFNTGRDVAETAHLVKYPPAVEEARATADCVERDGADDDMAAEGADKEDAVQQPETTVSLTDLAAALDRSASSMLPAVAGAAKLERGFDLDTTRKFARLLRKDEKVRLSLLWLSIIFHVYRFQVYSCFPLMSCEVTPVVTDCVVVGLTCRC